MNTDHTMHTGPICIKDLPEKEQTELYNYFRPLIISIITRRGTKEEEAILFADYLFAESSMVRKKFEDTNALKAYIIKSANNHRAFLYKERCRRQRFLNIEDYKKALSIDPHQQLEQREQIRLFRNAVETLPPACKKIFQLWIDGYSYTEISQLLTLSASTVKNQVAIALKKVCHYLAKY